MTRDGTSDFKHLGWHTITPRLVVQDARDLVRFVKDVFGATGDYQADMPAILFIGDSRIMISDAGVRHTATAARWSRTDGGTPGRFHTLRYGRHFLLLTSFSVLLGLCENLQPPGGLWVRWASYGALHAAALAGSLRCRHPSWKVCLFVIVAAALTVAAVRAGIFGRQVFTALPPGAGLYAALGISSALGAAAYGISIRLFGFHLLTAVSIAAISMGCLLTSCAALFMDAHRHFLEPWCFAVLWWYAYSAGLWCWDRRHAGGIAPRDDRGRARRTRPRRSLTPP